MKLIKKIAICVSIVLMPLTAFAETYTVNFKDADIKELIKFVADTTGYTVIIDPKVKGKVEVISQKEVDEKELYSLFLSVLNTHGYAAIRNGNILRIVQDKSARTSAVSVKKLIKDSLDTFFEVRKVPGLKKKPSTSELVDWLKLLVSDDLAQEILTSKQSNLVPPLYGALLKNEQDVELLQRLAFMAKRDS